MDSSWNLNGICVSVSRYKEAGRRRGGLKYMDHKQATKYQVVRLLYSVALFLVLAATAVVLDLLSQWVKILGVADWTYEIIAWSAHGMFALDMLLFFISLLFQGWDFVKGLRK